jgi:hypothetical protein
MLLARGADPNAKLKSPKPQRQHTAGDAFLNAGATPLMRAAKAGDVEVMRMLVDYGADPFAELRDGVTLLMIASGMGWRGGFDTLRDSGTEQGAIAAIQFCLEYGHDLKAVNGRGQTALHGAIDRGPSVLEYLVRAGADLHARDKQGRTRWRSSPVSRPAPADQPDRTNGPGRRTTWALKSVRRRLPSCAGSKPRTAARTDVRNRAGEVGRRRLLPSKGRVMTKWFACAAALAAAARVLARRGGHGAQGKSGTPRHAHRRGSRRDPEADERVRPSSSARASPRRTPGSSRRRRGTSRACPRAASGARKRWMSLVKSELSCAPDAKNLRPRDTPAAVISITERGVVGRGASRRQRPLRRPLREDEGWLAVQVRNFVPKKAEDVNWTAQDFDDIRAIAGDLGNYEDVFIQTPTMGTVYRQGGMTIDPVSPTEATGIVHLRNDPGRYEDVYVKGPSGWRFKSANLRADRPRSRLPERLTSAPEQSVATVPDGVRPQEEMMAKSQLSTAVLSAITGGA